MGFSSVSPRKRWVCITLCSVIIVVVALGVGLGVGLKQGNGFDSSSPSTPTTPPSNYTNTTSGTIWQPTVGESWQIVLEYALNDTSTNASVYDIDLFTNPASTFATLHSMNRKVICYFSAGSYEPDRPDSSNFTRSDKGKELDGWPGEYWLNTKSPNVRSIMTERLKLAASKDCDGVDPDNMDAYDNENGLELTQSDAVDFLTFLASSAHSLGMAIGLKNGGSIVNQTLSMVQWQVNEQCLVFSECNLFQSFITAGKPVFHIEYPASATSFSKAQLCGQGDSSVAGFSTVLKSMDLDDFVETCGDNEEGILALT